MIYQQTFKIDWKDINLNMLKRNSEIQEIVFNLLLYWYVEKVNTTPFLNGYNFFTNIFSGQF